jgi:hypothetical protein
MSNFRSASRTVVTEIKTFLVDSLSRTGAFRQSVSARVLEVDPFDRRDFNVNANQFFEFGANQSVLGISTPEPVVLIFRQTEAAAQQLEGHSPTFTQAVIAVDLYNRAGFPIIFSVRDVDLPETFSSVTVVVYNAMTGETDHVVARLTTDHTYEGVIDTVSNPAKGVDFDNSLNVGHDASVDIIYNDTTVTTRDAPTVTATTTLRSPLVGMEILVPRELFPENPIPVRLTFAEFVGLGTVNVHVINMSSSEEEMLELTERRAGVFEGSLPTTLRMLETTVSNDGLLSVKNGDTLQITYTKDVSQVCTDSQAFIFVYEDRGVTATFDGPSHSSPGDVVVLTLNEYNLRGRAVVSVPVLNQMSQQFHLMPFNETLPFTGVFRCSFSLTDDTIPISVNSIPAAVGDTISATYIDDTTESGETLTIIHTITVLQVPETEPDTDEASTTAYGEVSFLVNGLFYLNGAFNGTVIVKGLHLTNTRCLLLRS